jgi:hypothetical protein
VRTALENGHFASVDTVISFGLAEFLLRRSLGFALPGEPSHFLNGIDRPVLWLRNRSDRRDEQVVRSESENDAERRT